MPSAGLTLVSNVHAVFTSFEHRSCRQPGRKLWNLLSGVKSLNNGEVIRFYSSLEK